MLDRIESSDSDLFNALFLAVMEASGTGGCGYLHGDLLGGSNSYICRDLLDTSISQAKSSRPCFSASFSSLVLEDSRLKIPTPRFSNKIPGI